MYYAPTTSRYSRFSRLAVPGIIVAAAAACHAVAGEDVIEAHYTEIDEYIRALDSIPAEPSGVVEGEFSDGRRDGEYLCYSQQVEETRQYDELVAYNAGSESLWPGALLRGDSVMTGQLQQAVFDRAPATVSISLENLEGSKSATIEDPSLSTFREQMAGILDTEVTGATPANIHADIEQVHSREQLAMALGTSVSGVGLPGRVSASFDFEDETVRSRYLVRYTQSYYTVDLDQPGRPSDVFAPSVELADVEDKLPAGSPPAYVSSITYGRVVIFTFESQYSAKELGSALDFAYSGGVDVSGEVSVTYEEMMERSRINAYILGGSGGEAAKSLQGYDELMTFIQSGGDYSKDSPGATIAYKLAYLKDNSPVRMSFTRDYELRSCERVSQAVRVTLNRIRVDDADGADDLSVYGLIRARGANERTLLGKDRDNAIKIAEGTAWPDADALSEVILEVEPQPGNAIEIDVDLFHRNNNWYGGSDDKDLGWERVSLPFESGWRRETTALMTGSGKKVAVEFSLQPI
jgi:thiol-activated cytolysin